MENENENADSLNGENNENFDSSKGESSEEVVALKEKLQKIEEANRQLFERTKKAEGFEQKDGKWIKPEPKPESKPEPKMPKTSDELDYGHLAFHNTKSGIEKIETPEEQEFLKTEIDKSKMTQKELLENEYFTAKLKGFKSQQAAKLAVSEPMKSGIQSSGKNTVEYWISKGENPPDIPENKQLRRDIVSEKIRLDKIRQGVQTNKI